MQTSDLKINLLNEYSVEKFDLRASAGEHCHVVLEGYIPDSNYNEAKKLAASGSDVEVSLGSESIFCGIPYEVEITHLAHATKVKVDVITSTINLDKEIKTRSFQNDGMSVSSLMSYVSSSSSPIFNYENSGATVENYLCQYNETNWNFMRRIASGNASLLIPRISCASLTIDVGLSKSGKTASVDEEVVAYGSVFSNNESCEMICFESYSFYDLGSPVSSPDGQYFVYSITGYIEGSEVLFKYSCRREDGFKVEKMKNANLIGASLSGEVTSVSGTTVKVSLKTDKGNSLCGSRDFAYATIYSSNDGTGWYCMPEVGNEIRLYFPSDNEKDAYVISSVHQEVNGGGSSRTNPSDKVISNGCGKELIFSETKLILQNKTDEQDMSITLDDASGITIDSSLPVFITSDANIEITSGADILVTADEIAMKQKDDKSKLSLAGGQVTFEANEVRIQES